MKNEIIKLCYMIRGGYTSGCCILALDNVGESFWKIMRTIPKLLDMQHFLTVNVVNCLLKKEVLEIYTNIV